MGNDDIYCGNAKIHRFNDGGEILKISMTAEDVDKLKAAIDNGWVNLVTGERRTPSKSGFTHYVKIDTWKPTERTAPQSGDQSSGTGPERFEEMERDVPADIDDYDKLPF